MVKIGKVALDNGMPKICVPLVGHSADELVQAYEPCSDLSSIVLAGAGEGTPEGIDSEGFDLLVAEVPSEASPIFIVVQRVPSASKVHNEASVRGDFGIIQPVSKLLAAHFEVQDRHIAL